MFGLGEHVEVGEVLSIPADELWDDMIEGAHENGEPGVIYLERVNKEHTPSTPKNTRTTGSSRRTPAASSRWRSTRPVTSDTSTSRRSRRRTRRTGASGPTNTPTSTTPRRPPCRRS